MTLQSSGPIDFGQINVELGLSSNTQISLGNTNARSLAGISSGPISMSNFYSKTRDVNTTLLLHGDGVNGANNFTDSSSYNRVVSVGGNTKYDTSQSVIGTSSIYFGGSGDSLTTVPLGLASANFTVECYVKTKNAAATQIIATTYHLPIQVGTFILYISGNKFIVTIDPGYGGTSITTLASNTWYHIAMTYVSNGTAKMYVNGKLELTLSASIYAQSNPFYIGGSPGDNNIGGWLFNGWIDEFRVSNIIRYTSNFIPPV